MEKKCFTCGQVLPDIRLGARLTPFKAAIFDAIKHAGPDGIQTSDLLDNPAIAGLGRASLKSHVWQINELIDKSGFQIYGRGSLGWRLERKNGRTKGNPVHVARNTP